MNHNERYVAIHGQFSSTPDAPARPGIVCGITLLNDLLDADEGRTEKSE
jgi:hypothetical protein